jgi:transposase
MSERKRKNFTSQYKTKVALEAIRGVKTVNEIAQEFGVHPTQVGEWKRELIAQAPSILETKRGPKTVDPSASPERLYWSWIGLKKSPGSTNSRPQALG